MLRAIRNNTFCDTLALQEKSTEARCVRKKKYYIILQGGELTCFHFFLSRRVKLIVTSERLNIFKKCFHQSKVK